MVEAVTGVVAPASVAEARRADEIEKFIADAFDRVAADPTVEAVDADPALRARARKALATALATDPEFRGRFQINSGIKSALTWAVVAPHLSAWWLFIQFIPTQIPFSVLTFDLDRLLAIGAVIGGTGAYIWGRWFPRVAAFFRQEES